VETVPFIDIHTHQTAEQRDGYIRVRNVFAHMFSSDVGSGYQSVGIHPWHITTEKPETQLGALRIAAQQAQVIAIGESGLDRAIATPLDTQETAFEKQLAIAAEHNKPVIIHAVRTYYDILEVYKRTDLNLKMIFHGFNGNLQIAKHLIEKGFYMSFGEGLFSNHPKIREVFKAVPVDRIFLETDESTRPIAEIYSQACKIKAMELQTMKQQIHQNFKNCFGK
jgi:TatD DNase family protein